MEFNLLVKAQLFAIFQQYGLEISEEFKNVLRFQSPIIKVNVVFNEYENSHFVEIGRPGKTLYPLNNNAIKDLLGFELFIEQVTSEIFVRNLSTLFKTKEGIEMLNGNVKRLNSIISLQSENYTFKLLRKQALETASKAWEAKDYIAFIESIDRIGINDVPQSYQVKYEMAKRKL